MGDDAKIFDYVISTAKNIGGRSSRSLVDEFPKMSHSTHFKKSSSINVLIESKKNGFKDKERRDLENNFKCGNCLLMPIQKDVMVTDSASTRGP